MRTGPAPEPDRAVGRKSREKKERKGRAQDSAPRAGSAGLGVSAAALLCLVALLVYAHTIPYEFVYDDEVQVLRNPWIRDWSKVGEFFTTDVWAFSRTDRVTNYYRPFHMIAHAVGYSLSGLEPEGYHLLNILLHAVSTLLVAAIGLQLTKARFVAVAGGMIFALHPIHAESVTWIAGVTDPLCAVFYFGALYLYLRDPGGSRGRRMFAGTLLLFLGALFSKEMAFTFPLVAFWADRCLRRGWRTNRYAMLLGTFGLYGILRVSALGQFAREHYALGLNLYERALTSVVLLAAYVVKLFVPYDISAFHVFHPTKSILDVRFLWSAAALSLFALAAWWQRTNRSALFLFGFSILTLLPLMNISGVGENVFADRYLYLPSLGSCLLITLAIRGLCNLRPRPIEFLGKSACHVLVSPLLVVFGAVLVPTTFMWRDTLTLCTETLKRSPDSGLFTGMLARYHYYRGDYDKAEPLFRKALELFENQAVADPVHVSRAYAGLGGIHFSQGRLEQAREFFQKAYRLAPQDASVLQNLGSVHVALRDYPAAFKFFQAALEANPRDEVIYNNLAALYLNLGQYDRAIQQAQKAVEIYPRFAEAYVNLARAYAASGMTDRARDAYRRAARADPSKRAVVETALKELAALPAARRKGTP